MKTASNTPQVGTHTIFPAKVHEIVSETTATDPIEVLATAWRSLHTKEGMVWHRPSNSPFHYVADGLKPNLHRLPEHVSLAEFGRGSNVEQGMSDVINKSPVAAFLSTDQKAILHSELSAMYYMATGMSNCRRCYINIRIEHQNAFIERYHQDLGTVLLSTLAGPGTHFVTHDNLPSHRGGTFVREDLRCPEEVYEVPARDVLFMHGIPADGRALHRGEPNGLWHSSPPKYWQGIKQWESRVLLVATTPESKIVPLPPRLASSW
jgi:hypothetical protein